MRASQSIYNALNLEYSLAYYRENNIKLKKEQKIKIFNISFLELAKYYIYQFFLLINYFIKK